MQQRVCLLCKYSRKGTGIGQALCILTDASNNVLHTCADFAHFASATFHDVKRAGVDLSCSASTTATKSHGRDKTSKKHPIYSLSGFGF